MPRPAGPAHPLHLEQQRGGGWRARAGRIHLTVRPSAPAVLALLGWLVDGSPDRILLWVVAGLAALVVHEVVHAWTGQLGGATPYIDISWHGGVTRWQPAGTLSRRAELGALLAGPVAGAAMGWAALVASRSLGTVSETAAGAAGTGVRLGAEALLLFAGVSLAAAALDLLPIFPRDGARVLLLSMSGQPVAAVVRTASIGAVVAAVATGVLLATPHRALTVIPGFFLVSNARLAIRGDRAIGRPVPEAIDAHDWTSVRRRILAGCDSPELAAQAQERALAVSAFAEAADIGDAALARGWRTIGFARRTATARAFNEQDDLAVARVIDAVAFGADPDELAREPMLRHLAYRLDWPSAPADRAKDPGFAIDLRDRTDHAPA